MASPREGGRKPIIPLFRNVLFIALGVSLTACSQVHISIKPDKKALAPIIKEELDGKKERQEERSGAPQTDDPTTRTVTYYPKNKERNLAKITLGFGNGADRQDIMIDVRKDYRGYIVEAPVYQEEKAKASFAFTYDKERQLMVGFRYSLRW